MLLLYLAVGLAAVVAGFIYSLMGGEEESTGDAGQGVRP